MLLGASLLRISHLGVAKFANWPLPPILHQCLQLGGVGCICRVPAESLVHPCRVADPKPNINQNTDPLGPTVYEYGRHKPRAYSGPPRTLKWPGCLGHAAIERPWGKIEFGFRAGGEGTLHYALHYRVSVQ